MPRKLGGGASEAPEPKRTPEEPSSFLKQLLDEGSADGAEEELDTSFLSDHPSDEPFPPRSSDEEPAELELDLPDSGHTNGYEEFATIPTGAYTAQETPYATESDLSAYSSAGVSPDTFTGGARRSKKNRMQKTGSIATVPLKELPAEAVEDRTDAAGAQREAAARSRSKVLTAVFCGFLLAMLALFIVLPKTYFSIEERSVLSEEPEVSMRTVFSGKFEEDAEEYVSDHFPFRRYWIGLNSYYNLYSGRPLINGVYVGSDEYFIEEPASFDPEDLERNTEAIRAFVQQQNLPASFLCVPAAGFIEEDKLPKVHLPYHDAEIMQTAREQLAGSVEWIDITPDLEAEAAVEQVYYRTDHHWTTLGAYIAYLRYAQAQGFTPLSVDRFRISYYDGFKGTTYAKVLLLDVKPDMIQLWEHPGEFEIEMIDADKPDPIVTDSFYDMQALSGYDPYMVFFGGNHSLMHITNRSAEAKGKLLVIKDSFANSFLPFIAQHYAEIYVVDPRYYKDLSSLCDQNTFDEALFVYSTNNLVNDEDLGLIDM